MTAPVRVRFMDQPPEHDPEKQALGRRPDGWVPVFRKDHAQTINSPDVRAQPKAQNVTDPAQGTSPHGTFVASIVYNRGAVAHDKSRYESLYKDLAPSRIHRGIRSRFDRGTGDPAGGGAGRDPRRRAEIDPFDRALFLRSIRARRIQDGSAAETPTECKNAVVTKSVDFGAFGIAAAILGAAAGEPVVVIASTCNRGMAIIARKDAGINALKDLKGKRVAVFPGTTQEVFFLERLKMEGMTIKDVEPVRVSFSEMHISLARGDIDAYVGAEPGPRVSLSTRIR